MYTIHAIRQNRVLYRMALQRAVLVSVQTGRASRVIVLRVQNRSVVFARVNARRIDRLEPCAADRSVVYDDVRPESARQRRVTVVMVIGDYFVDWLEILFFLKTPFRDRSVLRMPRGQCLWSLRRRSDSTVRRRARLSKNCVAQLRNSDEASSSSARLPMDFGWERLDYPRPVAT